jgi:hypothetical protein
MERDFFDIKDKIRTAGIKPVTVLVRPSEDTLLRVPILGKSCPRHKIRK